MSELRTEKLEDDITFNGQTGYLDLKIAGGTLCMEARIVEKIWQLLEKKSKVYTFESGVWSVIFRRSKHFDHLDVDISSLGTTERYFIV
jgi:hypothetical protein